MSDEVKVSLPTEDELKRLTRRACVAYAVRAALRVEPLFHSDNAAHEKAVRDANQSALDFVGATIATDASAADARAVGDAAYDAEMAASKAAVGVVRAAGAAARAAGAAYEAYKAYDAAANANLHAARAAARANAAANAANAANADAAAACRADYEKLLAFVARSGDAAGELGTSFNVDEELGPLWPDGEPEWYRAASGKQEETASDDEGSLPTEDDLKRLTGRACVAYAVRAALRVEPLFHSDDAAHEKAVRDANQSSLNFIGATGAADAAKVAVGAVAYAAEMAAAKDHGSVVVARAAAAAYAAYEAYNNAANAHAHAHAAAAHAATLVHDAFADVAVIVECRSDYKKLLEISGDAAGELGEPIVGVDRDNGPLGPLWSNEEPEWFSADPFDEQIFPEIEPLEFLLEPGSATREEIRDLFYEMSKLYRMMGGSGINFSVIDAYAFDEAEVTA